MVTPVIRSCATSELYGGTPVSQINWSLLNDRFCGCKWSKVETNFEHQSVCRTSRQSQRRSGGLQLTIFDINTGFWVKPMYYGTLVSRHKVQVSRFTFFGCQPNTIVMFVMQTDDVQSGSTSCPIFWLTWWVKETWFCSWRAPLYMFNWF